MLSMECKLEISRYTDSHSMHCLSMYFCFLMNICRDKSFLIDLLVKLKLRASLSSKNDEILRFMSGFWKAITVAFSSLFFGCDFSHIHNSRIPKNKTVHAVVQEVILCVISVMCCSVSGMFSLFLVCLW